MIKNIEPINLELITSKILINRNNRVILSTGLADLCGVTPFSFSEYGTAMLASVLNSDTAIKVTIQVVRAFKHKRQMILQNKNLAVKINRLEKKYDEQLSKELPVFQTNITYFIKNVLDCYAR